MLALVIGGILIAYGIYGIVKRKMFYPFALFARERFMMDMARNKPLMQREKAKDYFIYDSYAIFEGIFLIIVGVVLVIVNF